MKSVKVSSWLRSSGRVVGVVAGLVRSRSAHSVAFAGAGMLLVGTPTGAVVDVDVADAVAVEHDVLEGGAVAALAVTADTHAAVAGKAGTLTLVHLDGAPPVDDAGPVRDAFVSTCVALPDGHDLDRDLELTDGVETWGAQELAATSSSRQDPPWLQLRAFVNANAGDAAT